MATEKGWSQCESSRVTSAALRQGSLSEHGSGHANQETGAAGKKWRRIHRAPDTVGTAC
jgi:hypothetical protein